MEFMGPTFKGKNARKTEMKTGTFKAYYSMFEKFSFSMVCTLPRRPSITDAPFVGRKLLAKIIERSDSQQLDENTTTQKHN